METLLWYLKFLGIASFVVLVLVGIFCALVWYRKEHPREPAISKPEPEKKKEDKKEDKKKETPATKTPAKNFSIWPLVWIVLISWIAWGHISSRKEEATRAISTERTTTVTPDSATQTVSKKDQWKIIGPILSRRGQGDIVLNFEPRDGVVFLIIPNVKGTVEASKDGYRIDTKQVAGSEWQNWKIRTDDERDITVTVIW